MNAGGWHSTSGTPANVDPGRAPGKDQGRDAPPRARLLRAGMTRRPEAVETTLSVTLVLLIAGALLVYTTVLASGRDDDWALPALLGVVAVLVLGWSSLMLRARRKRHLLE